MSADNEAPGSSRDDGNLNGVDVVCCQEQRSIRTSFGLHSVTQEPGVHSSHAVCTCDKSPFLRVLTEAEMAANAAAIQIVSFKDALEDELGDSRPAAADKRRFVRQRGLLLEKLEDFKRLNKSARQKLKQLQDSEVNRMETNQQIDLLKNKISEAESINKSLRGEVTAAERNIAELMELRREEQEKTRSAVNLNKSVELTRAHLQAHMRNKEADNDRLTVQLRDLQRTQSEQKLKIDDLNYQILALRTRAEKEQESLKKACQAQRLRAQKFEAAVEKYYDELREKDLQLTSARLELDSRRWTKEKKRDETDKVVAHVDLLKSEVSDLSARLQREEEKHLAATETLLQRVKKLTAENRELSATNAALEVDHTERYPASRGPFLTDRSLKTLTAYFDGLVAAGICEVAELQAEVDNLKVKYASLSRQTKLTLDEKDDEVQKLRRELQGRLQGLHSYSELLRASEKNLCECQENLQRSQRSCSEKTESVRQLQAQIESHAKFLRSSVDMRESLHKASLQLQDKVDSLHEQIERLRDENLELVQKLATQEEALRCSHQQLEQRSSDCQALTRQLEAALLDVKQQVNKAKEQALNKEEALQTRILELEAEKSQQDNEMRLLHQNKHMAEKQFEVRLKDLQLSLEQSESNKQSVQSYVDFLKQFYTTVFDDRLQTVFSSIKSALLMALMSPPR
uniref:Outer dense fiber protein 2-like n=1 Tax=Tetraodon nigroviridis TaxID=99883 RepID=H3DBJ6_TETNG